MKIASLDIRPIRIPFKISFKHSSAERTATQSVWVEVVSENGVVGYGEGCPREYVTNESLQSALEFFDRHKSELQRSIKGLADLNRWVNDYRKEIDKNPSVWCAIELALLDVIAKEKKQSVEELLNLAPIRSPFQYSAVLGDSKPDVFKAQVARYFSLDFADFKIKISGDAKADNVKLDVLKNHAKSIRVRLDANNLWTDDAAVIEYLRSLEYSPFAIEEPLTAGRYEELERISRECSIKIILDESFLKYEDLERIKGNAANSIVNLRISKMGGLLRSLAIAETARTSGIGLIVGAQVGETSLLTRAALTIANSFKDILVAQEGAFGTLLLEQDICDPPLMFKQKGLMEFFPSEPFGFQLKLQLSFPG